MSILFCFCCCKFAPLYARPAICFRYTGRGGWTEIPKSTSGSESAGNVATPTPALPEGFLAQFDCFLPDKAGSDNKVRDDLQVAVRIERSAANEGRGDRQLVPAERSSVSRRLASAAGSIPARKPEIDGVTEGVFGGAFSPTTVSPPDGEVLHPHEVHVRDTDSAAVERGRGFATPAVVAAPTTAVPSAESQTSPPEKYFIAYGHCLLGGAGTGASDEAAEAATAGGQSMAGDFGGVGGRARVRKNKRTRGYGDALEVFQEGLRRFPTSTVLLYGASLAMQARTCMHLKVPHGSSISCEV